MLSRTPLRRVATIWIVILTVASLQPLRPVRIHEFSLRHQALHILIFSTTAVVVLSLSRTAKEEWMGAAGLALLACAIEFAQFLIYRFSIIEWWDIREDSIGILLGLALLRLTRVRTLLLSPET